MSEIRFDTSTRRTGYANKDACNIGLSTVIAVLVELEVQGMVMFTSILESDMGTICGTKSR
jgi:hypothetical protein